MANEKKIDIGSAVRVKVKAGEVPVGSLGLVIDKVTDDHGANETDPFFIIMAKGKKDAYWTEELEAR